MNTISVHLNDIVFTLLKMMADRFSVAAKWTTAKHTMSIGLFTLAENLSECPVDDSLPLVWIAYKKWQLPSTNQ